MKNKQVLVALILVLASVSSMEAQAFLKKNRCCNPEPVCCEPSEKVYKKPAATEVKEAKPAPVQEEVKEVEKVEERTIEQEPGIVTETKTETQTETKSTNYYPGMW